MMVIRLAKELEKEDDQKFVLSGLLVVTNKFISKGNAECIWREVAMTRVGRIIFEGGMEEVEEKRGEKRNGLLDMYSQENLEAVERKLPE